MKSHAIFVRMIAVLVAGTIVYFYSRQPRISAARLKSPRRPAPREEGTVLLSPMTTSYVATDEGTKPVTVNSPRPRLGFMMAMHYSDQMTGAAGNLMNLQCFVGHHLKDVRVVEPFLHPIGSTLGVSLSPSFDKLKPQDMNRVKHSDVFDSEEWAQIARSHNFAPLVSWNEFLRTCSKKLILVYHVYTSASEDCGEYIMMDATREFVVDNKFEVVKQVCLNFQKTGILSPQEFIKKIYGKFKPNEVVVIFNRWGGLENTIKNYRLSLRGTSCYRGSHIRLYHHSKQLLSDVQEYANKYMNKADRYVAVMVRVERFASKNNLNRLSADVQRTKLMSCFSDTIKKAMAIKKEKNLTNTLLTMDVGKYGAICFRLENGKSPYVDMRVLNETVSEFQRNLMGESFSQSEWESSYEKVAHFKVPGYIAMMQLELAANSVCLLQAGGGGTFQGTARTLYNELHHEFKCTLASC